MKLKMTLLTVAGALAFLLQPAFSRGPLRPTKKSQQVNFRSACTTAQAQIDQDINNVRARLLAGGDMWWDRSDGKYVVPKPLPGQPEVSAIFAAGIWLGGFDDGGNLKTACQTYGNNGGNSDFWPGPLKADEGTTDPETCNNWDRHFEVKGADIKYHLMRWQMELEEGLSYPASDIPASVKGWPGRGNPYFTEIHGFDLPGQNLADFFDQDGDGNYEPLDGDFPTIEMRGCYDFPTQFPDQMIFWIYNDDGADAIHGETHGIPIRMEIQATAFAYSTDDQLNDMTFQRHKFINRAKEDIDSMYFGLFVDADLGCYLDDYIGCDPSRNLAYYYNVDDEDGQPGITCDGVPTYGTNIPAVGIDIFRGPLDENGNELGMSSFTYINNSFGGPSGTGDPANDIEFYRYLTGSWKDGTRLTYGGDGYDPTNTDPANRTNFAFPSAPNDPNGWSMCNPGPEFPTGLPSYDRRTVQSCGPFILQPGAVNELIFGVIWTPNMDYPCPDMSKFFFADDLAQCWFDNCFDFAEPVDAPDLDFVELDQEIVGVLTNKPAPYSNNFQESFEGQIPCFSGNFDSTYSFEGYLVYQLAGPDVSLDSLDDPEKARLIFNTDLKNGVKAAYNWKSLPNPNYDPTIPGSDDYIFYPVVQAEGIDDGVKHSFRITIDAFAEGDSLLINHKKYYFVAKAYAYNQYQPFDPIAQTGQKVEYMESRNNYRLYSATPRPILEVQLNASYGDQLPTTRLDGVGVGGNFVDMTDETLAKILDGSFTGEIAYKTGRSPIDVMVYNPLDIVEGEYEITFVDEDMANDELDEQVHWQLKSLTSNDPPILSDHTIDVLNEQLFAQYGFSVAIGQTFEAGQCEDNNPGAIGAEYAYADTAGVAWFGGVDYDFDYQALSPFDQFLDFVLVSSSPDCNLLSLASMGTGDFVPYNYCDYVDRPNKIYLSPAWRSPQNSIVANPSDYVPGLNNVDIFFTPDKSLWSRCVVVETFSKDYEIYALNENGTPSTSVGGSTNFDLRNSPSVGKDDANGDGLPDPDGDGIGMGWFPGYAIDVETGKRLNIFFGENSAYSASTGFLDSYPGSQANGADMLFNPNGQLLLEGAAENNLLRYYAGGQHFIYATNEEYDGCAYLRSRFDPVESEIKKVNGLKKVTWTSMPLLPSDMGLLPLNQGLIPNELRVKLRVNNPYQVAIGTGEFNGYPSYRFKVDGLAADSLTGSDLEAALALVNMVPNPFYNASAYADAQGNSVLKITNLPAKCTVSIYSVEGKIVRQFNRNEQPGLPIGSGIEQTQIVPDLEWNVKSADGKPVSTGVYLIHVKAPGIGERTLKLVVI